MAGTIKRDMPTPEIVVNMYHGSGATGTLYAGLCSVFIPFNATSTGTDNMAWINPENGTVMAKPYWVWRTAGTGTIIAGISSDGTGSNNNIITAGTMAAGVLTRATTGSALLGTAGEAGGYFLIGPGSTGTNNSIVVQVADTVTSTAVGGMVVEWIKVVP